MGLELDRRRFLQAGCAGFVAFLTGCGGSSGGGGGSFIPPWVDQGDGLGAPDANGVRLPEGFTSRIVARTGSKPVSGSSYEWHPAPDGGAVFPAPDGGWVYVSNAEALLNGGAGALRFAPNGVLVDAYSILDGTVFNCAGGKTPWGTWLSCEEIEDLGQVYECDPFGVQSAVVRPALGRFKHEAAAVDPVNECVYLTEDESDGGLYRFVPDNPLPDLTSGTLQVAKAALDGSVTWLDVPDPDGIPTATRYQVADMSTFRGGEGIAYFDGLIYFATKRDYRIWRYEIATQKLSILYAGLSYLTNVDNIEITPAGDVFVAEDPGDLQIVAVSPSGDLTPVLQLVGHDDSEIAGPALSPDGTRLYFSSQRGTTGSPFDGLTFEITGPFV